MPVTLVCMMSGGKAFESIGYTYDKLALRVSSTFNKCAAFGTRSPRVLIVVDEAVTVTVKSAPRCF